MIRKILREIREKLEIREKIREIASSLWIKVVSPPKAVTAHFSRETPPSTTLCHGSVGNDRIYLIRPLISALLQHFRVSPFSHRSRLRRFEREEFSLVFPSFIQTLNVANRAN